MTFRDNQDVYIDGLLKVRNGSIDVNGGVIRISGGEQPLRFSAPVPRKMGAGSLAFDAVDEAGKTVSIASLSRDGCAGCGK